MADGNHCISWGGIACSVIGGAIHLFSWRKGREAAQLEKVEKVERLSGKLLPSNLLLNSPLE